MCAAWAGVENGTSGLLVVPCTAGVVMCALIFQRQFICFAERFFLGAIGTISQNGSCQEW
jgi:hypothetical protein